MTTFYLIRHGDKACDPDVLSGLTPGIPLSERGRAQAEQLGRWLRRKTVARIYASPLERAQATAGPIAHALGLQVETCAALQEYDCGDWTGRRFSELAREPRWEAYNRFRSGNPIPGGESALAVQARVVDQLIRWADPPGQGIVVVSHGDPLRFAIAYFLGMPLDHFLRFEVSMGSVSVLLLDRSTACLQQLNLIPAEHDDG